MKIIRNRIIPFGRDMFAINLFGIIFVKQELSKVDENHEFIHTLQQRELLWVGFYLLYFVEWLVRLIQYRSFLKAYLNISFEKEAYRNERYLEYRQRRKHFAWRNYW